MYPKVSGPIFQNIFKYGLPSEKNQQSNSYSWFKGCITLIMCILRNIYPKTNIWSNSIRTYSNKQIKAFLNMPSFLKNNKNSSIGVYTFIFECIFEYYKSNIRFQRSNNVLDASQRERSPLVHLLKEIARLCRPYDRPTDRPTFFF
jgi:hypothetical protein